MSWHRPPAKPREVGKVLLCSRAALARVLDRDPEVIRRRCQPVACDVASRALLYDADEVAAAFRRVAA